MIATKTTKRLERGAFLMESPMEKITYEITWQNRKIKIHYTPDAVPTYRKIYGTAMCHVGIECDEPLPITSTGYRSHYIQADALEHYGGAVQMVTDWLVEESEKDDWKKFEISRLQLSLF